ncbi:hypothetical protein GCM10010156_49860 [Planobispora rosea]|uniref:Uncharacterized protein n=1 Tax=Planobispora rosea TaxID=35762 RepID=A0A8J3S2H6_PLARO|nr:hypothetical protein GCM10010156_49860 [Planobispora rosea]GIH86497.1 hypothetical protein Pro02_49050 [Planobispora rosea]
MGAPAERALIDDGQGAVGAVDADGEPGPHTCGDQAQLGPAWFSGMGADDGAAGAASAAAFGAAADETGRSARLGLGLFAAAGSWRMGGSP